MASRTPIRNSLAVKANKTNSLLALKQQRGSTSTCSISSSTGSIGGGNSGTTIGKGICYASNNNNKKKSGGTGTTTSDSIDTILLSELDYNDDDDDDDDDDSSNNVNVNSAVVVDVSVMKMTTTVTQKKNVIEQEDTAEENTISNNNDVESNATNETVSTTGNTSSSISSSSCDNSNTSIIRCSDECNDPVKEGDHKDDNKNGTKDVVVGTQVVETHVEDDKNQNDSKGNIQKQGEMSVGTTTQSRKQNTFALQQQQEQEDISFVKSTCVETTSFTVLNDTPSNGTVTSTSYPARTKTIGSGTRVTTTSPSTPSTTTTPSTGSRDMTMTIRNSSSHSTKSTISSSSHHSSSGRSRRRIRFNLKGNQIQFIENCKSLSRKHKNKVWYTSYEFSVIELDSQNLVYQRENLMNRHQNRGNHSSHNNRTISNTMINKNLRMSQSNINVQNNTTTKNTRMMNDTNLKMKLMQLDNEVDSIRGLEKMKDKESYEYHQLRHDVVSCVLNEQLLCKQILQQEQRILSQKQQQYQNSSSTSSSTPQRRHSRHNRLSSLNNSNHSNVSHMIDLHPYTMEIASAYGEVSYQSTLRAQERAYQDHLDICFYYKEKSCDTKTTTTTIGSSDPRRVQDGSSTKKNFAWSVLRSSSRLLFNNTNTNNCDNENSRRASSHSLTTPTAPTGGSGSNTCDSGEKVQRSSSVCSTNTSITSIGTTTTAVVAAPSSEGTKNISYSSSPKIGSRWKNVLRKSSSMDST